MRSQLLRLAHTKPHMRSHLVPLLRQAAGEPVEASDPTDDKLTRGDVKEFANLFVRTMLTSPPVKIKTAGEVVNLKKEVYENKPEIKQLVFDEIKKSPSAWRAVKHFLRGKPNDPADKARFKTVLFNILKGVAVIGGAALVGSAFYSLKNQLNHVEQEIQQNREQELRADTKHYNKDFAAAPNSLTRGHQDLADADYAAYLLKHNAPSTAMGIMRTEGGFGEEEARAALEKGLRHNQMYPRS